MSRLTGRQEKSVELVDAYGETFATIQDIIKPEPMKETVCPRCGQNPCVCSETYDIESMTGKTEKERVVELKTLLSQGQVSLFCMASAYASGALVSVVRLVSANWGNKTKKEEFEFSPSQVLVA